MLAWQYKIALEAERAANLCIACGQYGHYPVECPREVMPSFRAIEKQKSRIHVVACFIWFVVGVILGMWIKEGW